jgi:hypothetical protein
MKSTAVGNALHMDSPAEMRRHLFYETSHSPALADLVGYEKNIIDWNIGSLRVWQAFAAVVRRDMRRDTGGERRRIR